MVSVFEGQLSRTWSYKNDDRNDSRIIGERFSGHSGQNRNKSDKTHVINLYHDTITGKYIHAYISK